MTPSDLIRNKAKHMQQELGLNGNALILAVADKFKQFDINEIEDAIYGNGGVQKCR